MAKVGLAKVGLSHYNTNTTTPSRHHYTTPVKYKFIKNHFHQNHFHQKPLSSKTTFIKNHFHQKPLSSKTHFHQKPTFIKNPLSSKNHFHQKTTFIKNHFHQKTTFIKKPQKPLSSKNHFHQKTTFIKNHFHQKTNFIRDQFHQKPISSSPSKNNILRVCVKASRAEGPRRLHANTAYAHLWGLNRPFCSAERPAEGPKVGA